MGRTVKSVSFNKMADADVLTFAESIPNWSEWVKSKLREEIGAERYSSIDQKVIRLVEKIMAEKMNGVSFVPNLAKEPLSDDGVDYSQFE